MKTQKDKTYLHEKHISASTFSARNSRSIGSCPGAPPRGFNWGGGRILFRQTHQPPNSVFFSGFGHFILKITNNVKNKLFKNICKNRDFWGGRPPQTFEPGGASPRPVPPASAPMLLPVHCTFCVLNKAESTAPKRHQL